MTLNYNDNEITVEDTPNGIIVHINGQQVYQSCESDIYAD